MEIEFTCPTCTEKLDSRDVIEYDIVCWKCGRKESVLRELEDSWLEAYLDEALPYD